MADRPENSPYKDMRWFCHHSSGAALGDGIVKCGDLSSLRLPTFPEIKNDLIGMHIPQVERPAPAKGTSGEGASKRQVYLSLHGERSEPCLIIHEAGATLTQGRVLGSWHTIGIPLSEFESRPGLFRLMAHMELSEGKEQLKTLRENPRARSSRILLHESEPGPISDSFFLTRNKIAETMERTNSFGGARTIPADHMILPTANDLGVSEEELALAAAPVTPEDPGKNAPPDLSLRQRFRVSRISDGSIPVENTAPAPHPEATAPQPPPLPPRRASATPPPPPSRRTTPPPPPSSRPSSKKWFPWS